MTEQTINSDAKEAIDTVDYLLQVVLALWGTLPQELKALVLAVFAISVLMQWVKMALLTGMAKIRRVKLLWAASLPLGAVIALSGAFLTHGAIAPVYWALIGLTAGTIAMGVHYVTMKLVIPLFRFLLARGLLAVRGS